MTDRSSTLKANITKFKSKINLVRGDNTIVLSAFNELYGLVERLDYLKLDGLKRQELLLCFAFTNKYLSRINKAISKYEYDESFLLK